MMQLIWPGAMAAQAIYVAAKLAVADKLVDGPRTIDELATATKTHAPSLHRLLRALTSLSVFQEPVPGRFENTELSNTLRSDIPGSIRPWAIFLSAPFNWKLWGSLEDPPPTSIFCRRFQASTEFCMTFLKSLRTQFFSKVMSRRGEPKSSAAAFSKTYPRAQMGTF
jgi:hypothetical protein